MEKNIRMLLKLELLKHYMEFNYDGNVYGSFEFEYEEQKLIPKIPKNFLQ